MKELRATISNSPSRGAAAADRATRAGSSRRVSASPRRRVVFVALLSVVCLCAAGCRQDMQDQPRYEVYESNKFFADGQASRPYVEGTVARGHLKDDKFFYQGKNAGARPGAAGTQSLNASGARQGTLQTTTPNAQGGVGGAVPGGDVNVRGNVGGKVGQQGGEIQSQAGRDAVREFPFPVTKEVLDRGQERYQIYCAMCHGLTGYGDGMIVRRGFRRPPSYHDDRLRAEPVGHFFDVITNGWGAMPDYSAQIPPEDRWAIIAYLRALQLSQQAPASEVSPEMRSRATSSPTGSGAGAHQQGSGGEHK